MSINTIIICAICFALQSIRRGSFHINVFSLYDPIFYTVFDNEYRRFRFARLRKALLCNICFIALCVLITIIADSVFHIGSLEIRWGIGLGVFCLTWPYIATYRLYAFWRNPAVAVHLSLNVSEIVYAVCITDFCITQNAFALFALLIPVGGSMLRDYTHERHPYYHEEAFFQTKLYIAWKKIKLREPQFVKKYGDYIEAACRKYDLPELFLTRLMLMDQLESHTWYSALVKKLAYHIFPDRGVRMNYSYSPGFLKPSTAKAYVSVSDRELARMLNSPEENIDLLAHHIRALIDNYPGAGKYLPEDTVKESPCGAIEYDALDDTAQLCRYLVCRYRAGVKSSRKEYADICTDILLHSEADKLGQQINRTSS